MSANQEAPYTDHVLNLLQQLSELENELNDLWRQSRDVIRERRTCKVRYAYQAKKAELLARVRKRGEIDLYWAVMSGEEPERIDRVELKLRKNNIEHYEAQMHKMHRLRELVEALRRENTLKAQITAQHALISRKQEEIHRHRPCEEFRCEHCRAVMTLGRKGLKKEWRFLLRGSGDGEGEGEAALVDEDDDFFNIQGGDGGFFARVKRVFTGIRHREE